jgi:hypothetical protein
MTREQLLQMMAGAEELEELAVELDLIAKRDPSEAGKLEHRVAEELDRLGRLAAVLLDNVFSPGLAGFELFAGRSFRLLEFSNSWLTDFLPLAR